MKYISLLILLISLKGLSNGNQFNSNNIFDNTDSEISEQNSQNPVEGHDPQEAPISDYQYALLASAIGLGVYGFFKHKKVKTI